MVKFQFQEKTQTVSSNSSAPDSYYSNCFYQLLCTWFLLLKRFLATPLHLILPTQTFSPNSPVPAAYYTHLPNAVSDFCNVFLAMLQLATLCFATLHLATLHSATLHIAIFTWSCNSATPMTCKPTPSKAYPAARLCILIGFGYANYYATKI